MKKVLSHEFFNMSAVDVAQNLLGKYLVRNRGGKLKHYMIIETEAYDGHADRASHAYNDSTSSPRKGRTARTEVMFGPAGHFYVYLCYGMYWMLNIVTGPKDHPAAVLIRGVTKGQTLNQGLALNGPGKLTKALGIDKKLNGKKAEQQSGLWFEDRGEKRKTKSEKFKILRTPRIGVSYAGQYWANKKWRFVLEKKKSASRADYGFYRSGIR